MRTPMKMPMPKGPGPKMARGGKVAAKAMKPMKVGGKPLTPKKPKFGYA